MSTDKPHDNPLRSVTDKIRNWFERTPQAQRAYEKISADLDTVVSKVESVVEENETLRDLRGKVSAAIDPPAARPDEAVPASAAPATPIEPMPPTPAPSPSREPAASLPTTGSVDSTPPVVSASPPSPTDLPTASTDEPMPSSASTLPPPAPVTPPTPGTVASPPPSPVTPDNDVEVRRLPG